MRPAAASSGLVRCRRRGRRQESKPHGEVEGTPPARLAVEPDLAAHQVEKSRRNSQPQTGAFTSMSGTVTIRKRLENQAMLLRRNANAAVGQGKKKLHVVLGARTALRS